METTATFSNRSRQTLIAEAVRSLGGSKKVGELFKPAISRQAVDKWIRSGCIPAERVRTISKASGFPRGALNPDFAD